MDVRRKQEQIVRVGPFGSYQRFAWSAVRAVKEESTGRVARSTKIVLEGSERVQLAAGIGDGRRFFLVNALRHHLKRAPVSSGGAYRG